MRGAQADLSYRLKRSLFSDVGGFFHIQYFTGYGESLLDYDQRRHPQLRFGFSVVR
ncbi:MAG: phospholipase A [Betaproteobacteria bacterium]|nr:phospholipase A [Betaproteobacteria bacterium]